MGEVRILLMIPIEKTTRNDDAYANHLPGTQSNGGGRCGRFGRFGLGHMELCNTLLALNLPSTTYLLNFKILFFSWEWASNSYSSHLCFFVYSKLYHLVMIVPTT
jgi:hypothetical protein